MSEYQDAVTSCDYSSYLINILMNVCILQHEDSSLRMFDHLVEANGLKSEMKTYGLEVEKDLVFIKELVLGKPLSTLKNDAPVSTKDKPVRVL